MLRAAALVLAAALPASGAQWIRLATPNFELYTDAGEKTGTEVANRFEQVRGFFLHASPVRKTADTPVRIVQFNTQEEFERYRPGNLAQAYFIPSPARDTIVMGEATKTNFSIAIHEYMHLVIRQSGLRIPLWLNEGWCDVYSTLRPMGKEAAVGDLIESRMNELGSTRWLDFETLTSVGPKSPEYSEASRIGIFYAESWALTHMLYLAPEYAGNFGRFVMALHQGRSSAEAIDIAWRRTPGQVFKDLRSYFDRKRIYGRVFQTTLTADAEQPSVQHLTDFDSDLMLADLLAALGRRGDAEAVYAKLQQQQPGRADLARSMGYFALGNRDPEAERRHFTEAYNAGDSDPQMCFLLSSLDRERKEPYARVIAELERAIRSKPDFPAARMQLGLVQVEARQFAEGFQNLIALRTVTSAQAPAVYCALAYARTETGDFAGARSDLQTCQKWTKGDSGNRSVEALSRLLEARASPAAAVHPGEKLQQVQGVARSVDCSPEGNFLRLQVGERIVSFELPEPAAIEVVHVTSGSFNFGCGAQQPFRLTVEFAPPRSAVETSAGIVRRLEF